MVARMPSNAAMAEKMDNVPPKILSNKEMAKIVAITLPRSLTLPSDLILEKMISRIIIVNIDINMTPKLKL